MMASVDPWIVQPRERTWYEEQFKALRPNNGIITGDQAKGFFLQSQLPPLVLGQIWGLSDTDSDGKMDINEFSIACKLINLKLRGTEIPKTLPPQLISSIKSFAAANIPAVQPLMGGGPPARPQPPKVDNTLVNQVPLVQTAPVIPKQPLMMSQAPMVPPMMQSGMAPVAAAPMVQTAVVQPISQGQPVIVPGVIPPIPQQGGYGTVPMRPPIPQGVIGAPLIPGLPQQPVPGIPPPITKQPQPGFGTLPSAPPIVPPPPVIPLVQPVTGVVHPVAGTVPPPIPQQVSRPPSVASVTHAMSPGSLPPSLPGSAAPSAAPSVAGNTPRASIDKGILDSLQEWSVPHQTKLKYTQLFNTTDRARSGYLSGAQARNVMVQSKLPQNILAQIWALSDMDADGQLGCEEFVLAMHLCEQAAAGILPPTVLPPELVPPTFRRPPRTNSISSQGSAHPEQDHATLVHQTSFEDKRKENYEKGQAELERRRKALMDAQRKEAEERERKEREENDRREKARQEAERKRLMELEQQMREQQEKERQQEEERKRQADQREAARKEMERQRQLEWEKQRSQELQQQRQREQEKVLKLKAKNQSLNIELTSLNEQVKELSQKICDTRVGVSNIKTTIDGMRSTRDTQMQEMSQLKNKLKEQNARLLALSHEKAKMEAKNKMNAQMNNAQADQTKAAFENKEITIKQLKDKLDDMQNQIDSKMTDIENNNSQLSDLKTQLTTLVSECETLYGVYEDKKNQVLQMKGAKPSTDYNTGWKDTEKFGWDPSSETQEWPVENWASSAETPAAEHSPPPSGSAKYRALYEFVARNNDEISFQPGDIILVPLEQKGEPGWLAGEIRGHTGWFPESYVEPIDTSSIISNIAAVDSTAAFADETETKRLELIAEVPETLSDTSSVDPTLNQQPVEPVVEKTEVAPTEVPESDEVEYYIASYPYQSVEQGDLSFNAGEMIIVVKKDGDWWTGKISENVGIFPSNYVTKMEVNATTATTNNNTEQQKVAEPVQQEVQQEAPCGTDNEVCEINQSKIELDKSPDFAAMSANTQTLKQGKKPEIASVIAPYQATSPEQLSLQRGQLIMIRKKTDSGWWEGELQAKGKRREVGWFPASYVKVLTSSGRASGRTTPVSTTRMQQEIVLDKVIALFPYTANNPDELSFLKDDIISVTARDEPSWWRGELNGVSGLFPSNYVGPLQSFDPQEKTRQDCINELIATEQAYLEDMTIVHDIFERPLRKSEVISNEEIDGIFVNWQEIIQCNERFLEDLLDRKDSGSYIFGDIICTHLPRMTGYVTFCSNQLDSAALLQKLTENSTAFREIVKKCQSHPATKGMPLSSFLIKPMQRITKYPLIISKILENTPSHHPDFDYLCEAQRKADRFCKNLNEGVRVKENYERLEWIQTHVNCDDLKIKFNSYTNCLGLRKLLHHGVLQKLKSGKELIGFLFSDFLLLVLPNKPLGSRQFNFQFNSNWSYKMYKQPMFVNELQFSKGNTDSIENGTDMNRLLKIQDRTLQLSLLAPTANECNLWIRRIADARDTYNKVQINQTPKIKNVTVNACGRLLVLVQKGKRIIKGVYDRNYKPQCLLTIRCIKGIEIGEKREFFTLKGGKMYCDNIFCKVSLGDQEQITEVARNNSQNGNSPHPHNGTPQIPFLVWNASMQFHVKNINEDNLVIVVYERCLFSPDEFLGRAEVKVKDIINQTRNMYGPLLKRLILHQVESGEVELKLDLQMFDN